MSNIFNLPEATGVSDNDYIYISGVTNGDRKIKAEKLVGGDPVLITKTITENGTYNASSDDAEGYSSVTVEVEQQNVFDFYATNAKVADVGSYISDYLDKPLELNKYYVISITDPTKNAKASGVAFYNGSTVSITIRDYIGNYGRDYTITLTGTTVGVSQYSDEYRVMYAKVSELDTEQQF